MRRDHYISNINIDLGAENQVPMNLIGWQNLEMGRLIWLFVEYYKLTTSLMVDKKERTHFCASQRMMMRQAKSVNSWSDNAEKMSRLQQVIL